MLQKFYCFQILVAAVHIRNPLTVFLSVIQIEHRCHRVHADTVCMVFFCPEQSVRNQEIFYFRTAVIVNQSPPVRMPALPRVKMLIKACPVKCAHAERIPRKMRWNPVQDHADSLLMHIIHKIHKIFRRTAAAGRRIISGNLIAPGRVKRMLHNRHQFHMGIAQLFNIFCQHRRNFPVIVKFALPIFWFFPRANVHLINRDWRLFILHRFTLFAISVIRPGELCQICYDRRIIRADFRRIAIRV